MKRDQERELDLQLDRQMDSLAGQLRDKGISTRRDLWPDINQAIDRAEAMAGGIRKTRTGPLAGWRIAALAASVLLLVGVGLVQRGGLPGNLDNQRAGSGETAPQFGTESGTELVASELAVADNNDNNADSSMQVIDRALKDLNQALTDDPGNASLSHLILVIHRSRGNLIRSTARQLITPGF